MLNLYIYNLEGTLFEGQSSVVTLPSENGEISVLPHHVSLVTALKKGTVKFTDKNETKTIPIEKGFAYIDGESAVILAD